MGFGIKTIAFSLVYPPPPIPHANFLFASDVSDLAILKLEQGYIFFQPGHFFHKSGYHRVIIELWLNSTITVSIFTFISEIRQIFCHSTDIIHG